MLRMKRFILPLLLAVAVTIAAPVRAQQTFRDPGFLQVQKRDGGQNRDQGKGRPQRGPADDAADRARRETGGRVLSVPQPAPQGDGGYRVKILTPDGEVRYHYVDPRDAGSGRKQR